MAGATDAVPMRLATCGWVRVPALLDAEIVRWLSVSVGACYDEIDGLRAAAPLEPVVTRPGFVATASSFLLDAALSDADQSALMAELESGAVPGWATTVLHDRVLLDRDACWVRRQYPTHAAPAFHAPHGWHQDGALGSDFRPHGDAAPTDNALAPMLTCWIALSACGRDAPGLEIVAGRQDGLLPVAALGDRELRRRFAASTFFRPTLAPGDALLFMGDIVHRTHVTPGMRESRTSLELRFLATGAIPLRLRRHRFAALRARAPGDATSMH